MPETGEGRPDAAAAVGDTPERVGKLFRRICAALLLALRAIEKSNPSVASRT